MSRPFKLFRLQELDHQLDAARNRVNEIKILLSDDEALRNAQNETDQLDLSLTTARKARRNAENAARAQQLKIEQTDAALYGGKVRNPKELEDLNNEAAALRRYRRVLEDRQLEAMLEEEEAEEAYKTASEDLESITEQHIRTQKRLKTEKESLMVDIERLEDERNAAVTSIPAEDLELYEIIRKQRRGVAVARVSGSNCSACGTTINSALLYEAHSPNQISRCDSCSRILYVA